MRVILADDSNVNRKVALGQLKQLRYSADVVVNGREVLDALDRKDYDIVLMDVEMPELDGCELFPLFAITGAMDRASERDSVASPTPSKARRVGFSE